MQLNLQAHDHLVHFYYLRALDWVNPVNALKADPLARYVIGYTQGNKKMTEQINFVLKTLDVPVTALFSTLGRTAVRGLKAQWAAGKMRYFMDKLISNLKAGDLFTANVER